MWNNATVTMSRLSTGFLLKAQPLVLRNSTRYQSTVKVTGAPEGLSDEHDGHDHRQEFGSFFVFPRIQDISVQDLVGAGPFTRKSYFVERSQTGNLPVYSEFKANGSKFVTEIRKIQGNIIQLRNDLQEQLPYIPKDCWTVRPQSKKIIIKGDALKDVRDILSKSF